MLLTVQEVVPVLFLFCVALWFILRGPSCFKSSCALCPRVSSFLLAVWSPHLGKRELVCVLLVICLFVMYLLVVFFLFFLFFFHFSLPLAVVGWLRFVIVSLPGLFYWRFWDWVIVKSNKKLKQFACDVDCEVCRGIELYGLSRMVSS